MKRRQGFTLVELLVVIAIIGILVSLTAAAVQRVRDRGKDVQCRADITQLGAAITNFKARFGVYPPSYGGGTNGTFRLNTDYSGFASTSPEVVTLLQMFPRMQLSDNGLRDNPTVVHSNSNKTSNGVSGVLLDPNQCVMFFLTGGSFNDYQGFSTDPKLPLKNVASGASRLHGGSFWDGFANTSLRKTPNQYATETPPPTGVANRFTGDTGLSRDQPWVMDPWGTPYLFFVPTQDNNYPFDAGFTNADATTQANCRQAFNMYPFNRTTDSSASTTIRPARETTTRFKEPKGFQIFSAAKNKFFGEGGSYTAGSGTYALNRNGGDDYANFQQTPLGVTD